MPNNVKSTDIFKNFLNGVQLDFLNRSSLLHPLLPLLLQAGQVGVAAIQMSKNKALNKLIKHTQRENVKAFFYDNGDSRKLRLYIDEENLSEEFKKILLSIDPDFVLEISDDVQEKNIFDVTLTTQSIYTDHTSEYVLLKIDFDKNVNYLTNNFYRTISAILKYNEDNITTLKNSGSSVCDKNLIYPNNQNNQLNKYFFTMDNGPSSQICKNSQLSEQFEVIANKQNNELFFHFCSVFPDNRLTIKVLKIGNDIGYGVFNAASNIESIAYNNNELEILNKNGTYYQYNPSNSTIYQIHNPSSTTISTTTNFLSRETTNPTYFTTNNQEAQHTYGSTTNGMISHVTSDQDNLTTAFLSILESTNSDYSTSNITNPIKTTFTTSKITSDSITTLPSSSSNSSKATSTSFSIAPSEATTIPYQTITSLDSSSTSNPTLISAITPISSQTTSSDITYSHYSQSSSTSNVQTTQPLYTEPSVGNSTSNTMISVHYNKTTTRKNPNQHSTNNYDLIPRNNLGSGWIALITIGIFVLIGAMIFGFVFKNRKTNKICISHKQDDSNISMTDLRRNSNNTYSTIVDNINERKIQDKNDEKRKNLENELNNKTNSITNLLKPIQEQRENLKQNYDNYQFWRILSRILNWRINRGKINRDGQITNKATEYSNIVSTQEKNFICQIINNINISQNNINNFDIILPSDYHQNKKTFDEKKAKIIEILKFLHQEFSIRNCPVFYNALNNKEKSQQINDLFSSQKNIFFSDLQQIVNQLKIDNVFKTVNNLLNKYLKTFKDLYQMTENKNSLVSSVKQFLALIEVYQKELKIFKKAYGILKNESMIKNIDNYSNQLNKAKTALEGEINSLINPFEDATDSPQPSPKLSRQNSQESNDNIEGITIIV